MSYLPRMSKTYKEPEEQRPEEPAKEITFNNIRIASAQLDEKSYNPQSVLKQYSYFPHPPPVLPGPSLIQEAEENEKISIEAKQRRSREESVSKMNTSKAEAVEEFPFDTDNQKPRVNFALLDFKPLKIIKEESVSDNTGKVTKLNKTPKKMNKSLLQVNKSRDESVKATRSSTNDERIAKNEIEYKSSMNLIKKVVSHTNEVISSEIGENLVSHRLNNVKIIKSDHNRKESEVLLSENSLLSAITVKGSVHEGVQCSPMGASEKMFVMPSCIHCLMKTLSFLIQELDRNDIDSKSVMATKEVKKLIRQINETITALSSRKIDGIYALQTSLSDRKRLEKILSDLEQYIQDVYGENGKLGCKLEEKKRLFCKLFQKEYELNILNEKLRESEIQNPSIKQVEPTTLPPEVVLQNKSLENEQLRAEVEFNSQELKKFHQSIAEKNWEIYKCQEEISALKQKLGILKPRPKK